MKKNNKGFTLAELLIVVAIIAVLVAIAIPIFTQRLEGSRETTDLANLRSAYAAGQVALLSGDINTNSQVESYYNPDSATGLVAQAKAAKLGKGTKVDGGIDNQKSGIPGIISKSYSHGTVASGKAIKMTFKDGSMSKIEFAS